MKIGDKVVIDLTEHIKKEPSKKFTYVRENLLKLWKFLNGKEGTIQEIDGENIWVAGPKGLPRLFNQSVLKIKE